MKRYELIETYPKSPELGTRIENDKYYKNQYYILGNDNLKYDYLGCLKPEKYPKNWKEIVEKDYEILSFIANTPIGDIKKGTIIKKKEIYFHCYRQPELLNLRTEESRLLENTKWNIHSVKRLSDGEVFTVGDKISYKFWSFNRTLGSIFIEDNILKFKMEEGFKLTLEDMSHVKKPLFTTEDGADLFEGDKYYYPTHLYTISSEILPIENKISAESWDNLMRYSQNNNPKFSTKEAAEEYILMNKPCLSISDIREYCKFLYHDNMIPRLKELVKSKNK